MNFINDCEPALPLALKPGDTLGIVAPASPFDRKLFDAGIRALETMGFRLSLHEKIYKREGYLAGSDRHRANHLARLFDDPQIDGIICARGGYGTLRILELLDVDLISANPKAFVGFSDITALLVFLSERCRMVCFHGPTVTTLGKGNPLTRDQFFTTLTQQTPLSFFADSPRIIHHGKAEGRFLCGNLTLFCHLLGTEFQPDFSGCILLLEDQGEAPYRIDRMLTHMRLAGCFDTIAGLAVGTFTNCGKEKEVDAIIADRLEGLDIPVVAGFNVGHTDVNLTLPVNISVQLNSASGTLSFSEPAVR